MKALSIPRRLIELHPGSVGHSGPASAIAPAVVLMSISAFEGFIEDITATAMYEQGYSYTRIAQTVGNWTNPDIEKWRIELKNCFAVDLTVGFSVRTTRGTRSSNWSAKKLDYREATKLGSAWMNVRHALTHGEATGTGAERWPVSRKGESIGKALRPNQNDPSKHHLELPGAKGCAALYTYAARHGADLLAKSIGEPPIAWTNAPDFDPA